MRWLAECCLGVFVHKLKTLRRLQRYVRDREANYEQILCPLKLAEQSRLCTETNLMLEFAERDEEIRQTLMDFRRIGVDMIKLGQYFTLIEQHLGVLEYARLEKLRKW